MEGDEGGRRRKRRQGDKIDEFIQEQFEKDEEFRTKERPVSVDSEPRPAVEGEVGQDADKDVKGQKRGPDDGDEYESMRKRSMREKSTRERV